MDSQQRKDDYSDESRSDKRYIDGICSYFRKYSHLLHFLSLYVTYNDKLKSCFWKICKSIENLNMWSLFYKSSNTL